MSTLGYIVNMGQSDRLKSAISALLEANPTKSLKKGLHELSDRYRNRTQKPQHHFMDKDAHRYAYLATRMPATFAAIHRVLSELHERMPEAAFESMLDLGAGPGTVLWAAVDIIPSLQKATLLEQDARMISLGKALINDPSASWKQEDIFRVESFDPHDLTVISYALGELPVEKQTDVLKKAWDAASKALVVIEPGTPAGFETIRHARDFLLKAGACMVAPCPHSLPCPMAGSKWCHFSVRLERSKDHRQLKGGTLGYEDEKYSYLIVSKLPVSLPDARVLGHPLKRSGHYLIELCTPEGIKQEIVSKRNEEGYKQARKLEWGSSCNINAKRG